MEDRSRRMWLLLPMALAAAALAACAPPPTPNPDPTTPWLAPGCIDSSVPGVPDFEFSGTANELGNGIAFEVEGALSEDGTCTGDPTDSGVIVRAANAAGAVAVCGDLGIVVTNPARLVDFGYDAPVDAWTCLDVPPV